MEQDVEDQGFRYTVCSTCLSSDRDLFSLTTLPQVYQLFRLLMYDFAGDRLGEIAEMNYLICWECLAMFKRLNKFKWQVHNAQEHLRVLALSHPSETMDHTYMSQALSSLVIETKLDYDKIFFDFSTSDEPTQFIVNSIDNIKNEQFELKNGRDIQIDIEDQIMQVPEIVLDNSGVLTSTGVLSHIVVDGNSIVSTDTYTPAIKQDTNMRQLTIEPLQVPSQQSSTVMIQQSKPVEKMEPKPSFLIEYMSEADMLATREKAKQKVQYASAVYKCELCIIGFYTQQQVEDHFEDAHRDKPGKVACKVCYLYVAEDNLETHLNSHYLRHVCKICTHVEYSLRLMELHINSHLNKPAQQQHVIKIEGAEVKTKKKKKGKPQVSDPPKPGDLRKLLSKTTIEGYKCLECDMFFKNSRARKNHVARFHREGLQCDHCKKRFVNRTTLSTHLKLHEGPLPREECPICHKMVRVVQLKYHIQRHENKRRYDCADCNKCFSHLATYQAHLKYSRAHATEHVFKYPCPMCNKGYQTKELMQDHFNYQHLGKTAHKCPICDKPIASKANVEKHIARVHGEKKEKPKNHVCLTCGKSFTDRKSLTQHEAIHSGARPLTCEICHQTFKQKASLYTHRKRVHKVTPQKKVVRYIDDKVA